MGNATGNVGFDFNPTVDRIRVVDATGANMRFNQLTGATTIDAPFAFAPGDINAGVTPPFTAVAYTNSDNDPATGTTLFGIDLNLGQLITITGTRHYLRGVVRGGNFTWTAVADAPLSAAKVRAHRQRNAPAHSITLCPCALSR